MRTDDIYFLATLETRNFTFTAMGRTQDSALAAIEETWKQHADDVSWRDGRGFPRTVAAWDEIREAVNVKRFTLGHGYRDGTVFHQQLHPVPDHDHDAETDF